MGSREVGMHASVVLAVGLIAWVAGDDCYTADGGQTFYRGTANRTAQGPCLAWTADIVPVGNSDVLNSLRAFLNATDHGDGHNFCRTFPPRLVDDAKPWCYVSGALLATNASSAVKRWDYCAQLEPCRQCYDDGRLYRGSASRTTSGAPCAFWNDSIVSDDGMLQAIRDELAAIEGSYEHNFCRDPTAVDDTTPWCYTRNALVSKDQNGRWDYCDVPHCQMAPTSTLGAASDKTTVTGLASTLTTAITTAAIVPTQSHIVPTRLPEAGFSVATASATSTSHPTIVSLSSTGLANVSFAQATTNVSIDQRTTTYNNASTTASGTTNTLTNQSSIKTVNVSLTHAVTATASHSSPVTTFSYSQQTFTSSLFTGSHVEMSTMNGTFLPNTSNKPSQSAIHTGTAENVTKSVSGSSTAVVASTALLVTTNVPTTVSTPNTSEAASAAVKPSPTVIVSSATASLLSTIATTTAANYPVITTEAPVITTAAVQENTVGLTTTVSAWPTSGVTSTAIATAASQSASTQTSSTNTIPISTASTTAEALTTLLSTSASPTTTTSSWQPSTASNKQSTNIVNNTTAVSMCDVNVSVPHGQLSSPCAGKPGSYCTVQCVSGFSATAEQVLCSRELHWAPPLSSVCMPAAGRCDFGMPNGEIDRHCGRQVGEACNYTCSGRRRGPVMAVRCVAEGKWSPNVSALCSENESGSDAAAPPSDSRTGLIVGVTIAVIVAVALIALGVVFLLYRFVLEKQIQRPPTTITFDAVAGTLQGV